MIGGHGGRPTRGAPGSCATATCAAACSASRWCCRTRPAPSSSCPTVCARTTRIWICASSSSAAAAPSASSPRPRWNCSRVRGSRPSPCSSRATTKPSSSCCVPSRHRPENTSRPSKACPRRRCGGPSPTFRLCAIPFRKDLPAYAILLELTSTAAGRPGEPSLDNLLEAVITQLAERQSSPLADIRFGPPERFLGAAPFAVRRPAGERAGGRLRSIVPAQRRHEFPAGRRRSPGRAVSRVRVVRFRTHRRRRRAFQPGAAPGGRLRGAGRRSADEVLRLAVEDFGASFSGEHGIGRANQPAYDRFTPGRHSTLFAAIARGFSPEYPPRRPIRAAAGNRLIHRNFDEEDFQLSNAHLWRLIRAIAGDRAATEILDTLQIERCLLSKARAESRAPSSRWR